MKHLITISLLLFSFCSFGQVPREIREYDSTIIWIHNPMRQSFNIDSVKKKSPKFSKWIMDILREDSVTIFWHGGDRREFEQLDSVKSLTIRGYSGPLKLTLKVCQHIYVAVEQPEVNGGTFSVLSIGKFGKHEGKEIVCIKCHHLRKQIVDYGQAGQLQLGDIVLPKEH